MLIEIKNLLRRSKFKLQVKIFLQPQILLTYLKFYVQQLYTYVFRLHNFLSCCWIHTLRYFVLSLLANFGGGDCFFTVTGHLLNLSFLHMTHVYTLYNFCPSMCVCIYIYYIYAMMHNISDTITHVLMYILLTLEHWPDTRCVTLPSIQRATRLKGLPCKRLSHMYVSCLYIYNPWKERERERESERQRDRERSILGTFRAAWPSFIASIQSVYIRKFVLSFV